MSQRYHIGPNGVGVCRARKRPCQYAAVGSLEEMTELYEQQCETADDSFLAGKSKTPRSSRLVSEDTKVETTEFTEFIETKAVVDPRKATLSKQLSAREHYSSPRHSRLRYSEEEIAVAQKVATSTLTPIGYTTVEKEDASWSSDGFSSVSRLLLSDGTVGYFKSLQDNTYEELIFKDYGTTSLSAAVNEVNAYRLAQAMGEGYSELVPETSFTYYGDSVGTLQREAIGTDKVITPALDQQLQEDYRRAMLFDFVIGNVDRHNGNFLVTKDAANAEQQRFTLIDNSFTFARDLSVCGFNDSYFANNESIVGSFRAHRHYVVPAGELQLTREELTVLDKTVTTVEDWMQQDTILKSSGQGVLDRVKRLQTTGRLEPLSDYISSLRGKRF